MLQDKRILLIIAGGIAAYKSLDLIRRLRERGVHVRVVLTKGGAEFVTPLSAAALSEDKVFMDLFSLTDESEMGHIRLSREADLLLVAPATASILARMAAGIADDLATTVLLATDKPVMIAPAMNVEMWKHAATRRNLRTLAADGVLRVGPGTGDLACGEVGAGRMAEPLEIVTAVEAYFAEREGVGGRLGGRRALVTSGPTYEAIDPVRYIANRSSGKQGHAIAAALAGLGAQTILVSGPTAQPDPPRVTVVHVESAREMLAACEAALPADVAVCAAAVADWRATTTMGQKLKKDGSGSAPSLAFVENPDILASLSARNDRRPGLVIGFAAETENVLAHAEAKRRRKGCDWMIANDVSQETGIMGGEDNCVHVLTAAGADSWPRMSKADVATKLAQRIADHFEDRGGGGGRP